jgi:HD superfamily phosphohydrolase
MHSTDPSKPEKPRMILNLLKPKNKKYRKDIVSETIELLRRRYSLAEKVYYHHAKISASSMLISATLSALENAKIKEGDFFKIGDVEFLNLLKSDEIGLKIINKLEKRELYKPVYKSIQILTDTTDPSEMISDKIPEMIYQKFKAHRNIHYMFERNLEKSCFLEPGDVCVYCPEINMSLKLAETITNWGSEKNGLLMNIPVKERKDDIASIVNHHKHLWSIYVFINPTVFFKDSEEKFWVAHDAEKHFELKNAFDNFVKDNIEDVNVRFEKRAAKELGLMEYQKVTAISDAVYKLSGVNPDLSIPSYAEYVKILKEKLNKDAD